jgi:transposase, IS6 family
VLLSRRRGAAAARALFTRALRCGPAPVEVVTDRAPVYRRVVDEVAPAARRVTERFENNAIETDHGRLRARLRSMRGLKRLARRGPFFAGRAIVQNLRRGAQGREVEIEGYWHPYSDDDDGRSRCRGSTVERPIVR